MFANEWLKFCPKLNMERGKEKKERKKERKQEWKNERGKEGEE